MFIWMCWLSQLSFGEFPCIHHLWYTVPEWKLVVRRVVERNCCCTCNYTPLNILNLDHVCMFTFSYYPVSNFRGLWCGPHNFKRSNGNQINEWCLWNVTEIIQVAYKKKQFERSIILFSWKRLEYFSILVSSSGVVLLVSWTPSTQHQAKNIVTEDKNTAKIHPSWCILQHLRYI